MMIGEALGEVLLSRGISGMEGKRFVQVRCGEMLLTALDTLETQKGETVLLCAGKGAAVRSMDVPVDAVILGVVGENRKNS